MIYSKSCTMPHRERIVADIQIWKPLIILDHREIEGDFFVAAEHISPETVNFMLRYGRGVLCVSMLWEMFERFEFMRPDNMSHIEETHFGQAIDALHGITTGISAVDRAHTLKLLADLHAWPKDFHPTEGHIRTLEAHSWWLAMRAWHTEASIALCQVAWCQQIGVIIEILNDDGTIAQKDDLLTFAKEHDLCMVTVNDLKDKFISP